MVNNVLAKHRLKEIFVLNLNLLWSVLIRFFRVKFILGSFRYFQVHYNYFVYIHNFIGSGLFNSIKGVFKPRGLSFVLAAVILKLCK